MASLFDMILGVGPLDWQKLGITIGGTLAGSVAGGIAGYLLSPKDKDLVAFVGLLGGGAGGYIISNLLTTPNGKHPTIGASANSVPLNEDTTITGQGFSPGTQATLYDSNNGSSAHAVDSAGKWTTGAFPIRSVSTKVGAKIKFWAVDAKTKIKTPIISISISKSKSGLFGATLKLSVSPTNITRMTQNITINVTGATVTNEIHILKQGGGVVSAGNAGLMGNYNNTLPVSVWHPTNGKGYLIAYDVSAKAYSNKVYMTYNILAQFKLSVSPTTITSNSQNIKISITGLGALELIQIKDEAGDVLVSGTSGLSGIMDLYILASKYKPKNGKGYLVAYNPGLQVYSNKVDMTYNISTTPPVKSSGLKLFVTPVYITSRSQSIDIIVTNAGIDENIQILDETGGKITSGNTGLFGKLNVMVPITKFIPWNGKGYIVAFNPGSGSYSNKVDMTYDLSNPYGGSGSSSSSGTSTTTNPQKKTYKTGLKLFALGAGSTIDGTILTIRGILVGSPRIVWKWGDGQTSTSTSLPAKHTYAKGGSYSVTAVAHYSSDKLITAGQVFSFTGLSETSIALEKARQKALEAAKQKAIEIAKQKAIEIAKQKALEAAKQKAAAKQEALAVIRALALKEAKQKALEAAKQKALEAAKQKALEIALEKVRQAAIAKQKAEQKHNYHPEWEGWQGAGYYSFPAFGNRKTGYVTTPAQLNQWAFRITGGPATNLSSLLGSSSSGSGSSGSGSGGGSGSGSGSNIYGSHSNPYSAWSGYQGAGWYRWTRYGVTRQIGTPLAFSTANNQISG